MQARMQHLDHRLMIAKMLLDNQRHLLGLHSAVPDIVWRYPHGHAGRALPHTVAGQDLDIGWRSCRKSCQHFG